MKKTYMIPTSKTIILSARHQMLTGSNPEVGYDTDPEHGVAPGGVESHFDDFDWDDEEEY